MVFTGLFFKTLADFDVTFKFFPTLCCYSYVSVFVTGFLFYCCLSVRHQEDRRRCSNKVWVIDRRHTDKCRVNFLKESATYSRIYWRRVSSSTPADETFAGRFFSLFIWSLLCEKQQFRVIAAVLDAEVNKSENYSKAIRQDESGSSTQGLNVLNGKKEL